MVEDVILDVLKTASPTTIKFLHKGLEILPRTTVTMLLLLQLLLLQVVFALSITEPHGRRADYDRAVDVAIVGAGPSGTYAAYKLRERGLNIELFEFSDRIGGRLFSSILPNTPDVVLELGGMRYCNDSHTTLKTVLNELDLESTIFPEGFGRPGRTKYYLRGHVLTEEDLSSGFVPYALTKEEKDNQEDLIGYYVQKLSGHNGEPLSVPQLFELKYRDGTPLYTLTFDQAMDLVASPEGKEFVRDRSIFETLTLSDSSFASILARHYEDRPPCGEVMTVVEGMSAIPQAMAKAFIDASRNHRLSLNKRLHGIQTRGRRGVLLEIQPTITRQERTFDNRYARREKILAKQVILAIPVYALRRVRWSVLREQAVRRAMYSVRPWKTSKIFMTFPYPWWLERAGNPTHVMFSDIPFSQMYDWRRSNISGDYILLGSYGDGGKTRFQERLRRDSRTAPGSVRGDQRVSKALQRTTLQMLGEALDFDPRRIPRPKTSLAQFWTTFPYGGGWTILRAGYIYEDVWSTIMKPSSQQNVFVVGTDWSFGYVQGWTEGGLRTVDEILDTYFK